MSASTLFEDYDTGQTIGSVYNVPVRTSLSRDDRARLLSGSSSTNSYSRTTSTLLTSSNRTLTARSHLNNHESSLILANAGVTSASALNATILSGASTYSPLSENPSDTKLNLEAQRLERRRLKNLSIYWIKSKVFFKMQS